MSSLVAGGFSLVATSAILTGSGQLPAYVAPAACALCTVAYAIPDSAIIGQIAASRASAQIVALAVGPAALLVNEGSHNFPMLDLRPVRRTSHSIAIGDATTTMFVFANTVVLSVLMMEHVKLLLASGTVVHLLTMSTTYGLVGVFADRLLQKAGSRTTLTAGLLIGAAGALTLLATGTLSSFKKKPPVPLSAGVDPSLPRTPPSAATRRTARRRANTAFTSWNTLGLLSAALGSNNGISAIVTGRSTRYAKLWQVLTGRLAPPAPHAEFGSRSQARTSSKMLTARTPHIGADSGTRTGADAGHTGLRTSAIVELAMAIRTAVFVRHPRVPAS